MADQHVLYCDDATGIVYDVSYDYYIDPAQITLDYVLVNDREVKLYRLPKDLKQRMLVAARRDYDARCAEEWRRLDVEAATRLA